MTRDRSHAMDPMSTSAFFDEGRIKTVVTDRTRFECVAVLSGVNASTRASGRPRYTATSCGKAHP
jgi:hypothetical protein